MTILATTTGAHGRGSGVGENGDGIAGIDENVEHNPEERTVPSYSPYA